ncbi:MAG: methyl-accepting chemotaxis sensory transducer with Cache sensor [Caproiciproducens sp.]|nr:methyl-accepting chemotaxis sensory transducer with Cache sensor [Caproiciproducens sp.]
MTGQVQGITGAIQEIATGSQPVVNSVKEIEQISKGTAGYAETVSAATQEQAAEMSQITDIVRSLEVVAEKFMVDIARFKV